MRNLDLFQIILILASRNNVTLVCGYCGMIRCMLDMDTHCSILGVYILASSLTLTVIKKNKNCIPHVYGPFP